MTAELPQIAAPTKPLPVAQDFYELRREGIGYVVNLGSDNWTDYNSHDPGITILEAVTYAMTELAWRTHLPIGDILRSGAQSTASDDPYPGQPFFTPRSILTVNPTTPDDFRRLLIDLDAVRNAWVRCRTCACDLVVYAWCEHDQLRLSYDPSERTDTQTEVTKVEPKGLYDVALEFEDDDDLGSLNDRKLVTRRTVFDGDGRPHQVTIEVRFPAWDLVDRPARQRFMNGPAITGVSFSGGPVDDDALRRNWQHVLFYDLDVTLDGGGSVPIPHASMRVFGDRDARAKATVPLLEDALADLTPAGFIPRYRAKLAAVGRAIDSAKMTLEAHRNLDEDYCHVRGIEVCEVAVCADVEVRSDADIELVQANIWFEIERYLNPPIPFHFLDELLADGVPVEAIFNGPELSGGFLDATELEAAGLRSVIRVSDIIDRLMDLPGVIAVNNLQLTAYDAEGAIITGSADPTWTADGTPQFDPTRASASWLLYMRDGHQPRLYQNMSRFLFLSDGLPLAPRMGEAEDTLVELRGAATRPKLRDQPNDLPVPTGVVRDLEAYFPVQHSFPQVYGIGPAGLPSTATKLRKAQAKQLKAYLLVFEQMLRNSFAQLAHTADLFSLAPQTSTYFTETFTDDDIDGYSALVNGLGAGELARLVESEPEFAERRNRFLDHLLARFGEQFGEYAMLLTGLEGVRAASQELIADKIGFLNAYPRISHDRGKAFNRVIAPSWPSNVSGLKHRISLQLGYPDYAPMWTASSSPVAPNYTQQLALRDRSGAELLTFAAPTDLTTTVETLLTERGLLTGGQVWEFVDRDGTLVLKTQRPGEDKPTETPVTETDDNTRAFTEVLGRVFRSLLADLVVADRYQVLPNGVGVEPGMQLIDVDGTVIGEHASSFDTKSAAESFRSDLLRWSANERATVVEHLLLRPKFPGDALYPVCSDGCCATCGDEDPYSFRLTFVMPGWTAPFNTNMQLRGFADRTIQQETPSHLVVKTCWVGNDGYIVDPCDPVVDTLALLLEEGWRAGPGEPPIREQACTCAGAILSAYREAFEIWYEGKTLEHHQRDALREALSAVLASVDITVLGCAAEIDADLRSALESAAVEYFSNIALRGRQFERFEDAWCGWLLADSRIEWTEERLAETVTELLRGSLAAPDGVQQSAVCSCASDILASFGAAFAQWRDANIRAGTQLADFTEFDPGPITLCPNLMFEAGAAEAVRALLMDRYATYTEVSYRLRLLVDSVGELHNTYPTGTLHDCSEGSGRNPIRLGQTALGSNVQ